MTTTKKCISKDERKVPEIPKKIPDPVMYIGPTITEIGVIRNTMYTEIPDAAQSAKKDCPVLGALFIPVASYAEAERCIRERTGYYWSAFKAALEYQTKLKRR